MVAKHGVELDALVEQRLVGLFELGAIVVGRRRSLVDVVAEHQDERERKRFAVADHLRRDLVLRRGAAAAVANHRELHRRARRRERQRPFTLGRRNGLDRGRARCGRGIATAAGSRASRAPQASPASRASRRSAYGTTQPLQKPDRTKVVTRDPPGSGVPAPAVAWALKSTHLRHSMKSFTNRAYGRAGADRGQRQLSGSGLRAGRAPFGAIERAVAGSGDPTGQRRSRSQRPPRRKAPQSTRPARQRRPSWIACRSTSRFTTTWKRWCLPLKETSDPGQAVRS